MAEVARALLELPPHLPPRDAWLADPDKIEKFYVPTDDRGFVIPDAAVESVLELIDPSYRWPVDWARGAHPALRPDDHHFHWIKDKYKKRHFKNHGNLSSVPQKFRELPTLRGVLPRQFHNVVHDVTLPPLMPRLEDMKHYLESFAIARSLLGKALDAKAISLRATEEMDDFEAELFKRKFDGVFKTYEKFVERAAGTRALRALGVEIDDKVEALRELPIEEMLVSLGSCALTNSKKYTEIYFVDRVEEVDSTLIVA